MLFMFVTPEVSQLETSALKLCKFKKSPSEHGVQKSNSMSVTRLGHVHPFFRAPQPLLVSAMYVMAETRHRHGIALLYAMFGRALLELA